MHMGDVDKGSAMPCSRLCSLCALEEEDVTDGLAYWINKGVVREMPADSVDPTGLIITTSSSVRVARAAPIVVVSWQWGRRRKDSLR